MHLVCLYKDKNKLNKSLLNGNSEKENLNDESNNIERRDSIESCISKHEGSKKQYSKLFRYIGYGIIVLIGFAIAVSTIAFVIIDAVS